MKSLFKVLAGLVVVLALVAVLLLTNLGSGIKALVEELGPQFVQADVKLDQVDLSLSSGEGSLKGLTVGNPTGFTSANAFSLDEIALAIQPDTITTDTIVINSIRIIAPEITYESAKGGSNIDQLQKNVEQAVERLAGGGAAAESEAPESSSKKLIIRDFLIRDGKVRYSNPLLGSETVDVALPTIRLTGIGEKSGGATAVEVVNLVLASINKQAVGAIGQAGLLEDAAKGAIEKGKARLEEKLGGFKGLLKKDKD